MSVIPASTLTEAIVAVEDVSSRIEDVFFPENGEAR